ncbi:MAG: MarR family winged helix-turn-helix transcriptional regulator [Acidimicrobiia bacterium]
MRGAGLEGVVEVEEALTRLAREVPRLQERALARAGVPFDRAAYLMLRWVGEYGEIRLSDLAGVVGVDVSTASRQVRVLEDEKLLERSSDERDRRVCLLRLTPAGEDAMLRLRDARRGAVEEVLAGWSSEERQALAALVLRLADDVAGQCRKDVRQDEPGAR